MAAATEDELGELHNKVARTLNKMLDGQEIGKDEDGEPIIIPTSAAVLTASIQFLKNNAITAPISKGNATGELVENARRRAAERAARSVSADEKRQAEKDMAFLGGLQ